MTVSSADRAQDRGGRLEPRRLAVLAEEIGAEVAAAETEFQSAVRHAIRAGEKLIEAKGLVSHGQWLPWLAANFPGSERTARNYIRLAQNGNAVADLPTVRDAIAELSAPKATPDEKDEEVIPEAELGRSLDLFEKVTNALTDAGKHLARVDEALTGQPSDQFRAKTLEYADRADALARELRSISAPDQRRASDYDQDYDLLDDLQAILPDLTGDAWEAFKQSIDRLGVLVPVVKDHHGRVIDGRQRIRAANELGIKYRVDVVKIDPVGAAGMCFSLNFTRADRAEVA